jgi:very-short-patch-repair endonuclease
MAAILASGPRALVGMQSAGYMWGLRSKPPGGVDVIVVGRKIRSRPGIRTHRVENLMRSEVREIMGIPVTSPARTIFDLAGLLDERELEIALHEAIALKLVRIEEVRELLERYPRRPGSAGLKCLTAPDRRLSGTESGGEELLARGLRRARFPRPCTRYAIGRWILDFYWPEAKMGAEVDGVRFHSTRPRIERDHLKDQELRSRHGVLVLRFTARQTRRDLDYVLVTIAIEYGRRLRSGEGESERAA